MVMTQRGQGRDGGSAQSWVKLGEAPRPSWRFEEGFLGEVRLEREELAREERVKEWWAEGPCGLRPGAYEVKGASPVHLPGVKGGRWWRGHGLESVSKVRMS